MPADAAALKQKGNELFKAGNFSGASKAYAKAENADPFDPIYPSNLSASLFETGDYTGSVNAVLRSWKLLQKKEDTKAELVVRLSTRLARALCHGVRAGTLPDGFLTANEEVFEQLQVAAAEKLSKSGKSNVKEEWRRAWKDWEIAHAEREEWTNKGDESLSAFIEAHPINESSADRDQMREFYKMGTDDIIDLTQGWGPGNAYPLQLEKLPLEFLPNIAFMFGGVGDGRHAFGTIAGLHRAFSRLSKAKKKKFHAHLTLLDIHDATVARDLCVLMLLNDLTQAPNSTAKAEITATLMYIYCGAAMPSYCYDRLQTLFKDLRRRLTSNPPELPEWLHVVSDTTPAILQVLEFWIHANKSTRRMLAGHQNMRPFDRQDMPSITNIPGASPAWQQTMNQNIASQKDDIRKMLLNMPDAELAQSKLVPLGTPASKARALIRENLDMLVDEMQHMMLMGKIPTYETTLYDSLKVFIPPDEILSRHPGFNTALGQVKATGDISPALARKLKAHIENDWKPNITIFDRSNADPKYFPDADGYPDLMIDMFQTIGQMDKFVDRDKPTAQQGSMDDNALAWQTCSAFFNEVAGALKALSSHVTLELIVGGLSEELAKMRFKGDVTRPKDFPRKYTRMWLSNVPDYTHGPMNMILYVIPNLQDDPQAAVCCNVLLNTGAWAGDEEYMHTYTLLTIKEVPRYLGCVLVDSQAVMEVLVLGSRPMPRPLSELATRPELTTWLTRVLFNTFIPGRSKPNPSNVRLPHNLVAFFGLLMYLHRVGYPGHWLSDFLARILSGRMVSDITPYVGEYPIPVSERSRRVPSRTVRTDPWLVEFETIVATAYYAIPFPVSFPNASDSAELLPAGGELSRDAEDMGVWEAHVRQTQEFTTYPWLNNSPYEPRTHLLFYRADILSASSVISTMKNIFEGKTTPAPGTFFVLTAQEHVQYQVSVRWRMSRVRVERMRGESLTWSMVAYRNDNGQLATHPVSIQKWNPYSE